MSKEFTEMQLVYIKNVIEGMSHSNAAEIAGYSCPDQAAQLLKRNEKVQKAIYIGCMAALTDELLPKSLRRLDDILDDLSAAPSGVKLKAAQYVIDKAQALQEMANARDIADKNPLDMSQAELEFFIARGRIVLNGESRRRNVLEELGVIDAEPA